MIKDNPHGTEKFKNYSGEVHHHVLFQTNLTKILVIPARRIQI